MSKGDICHFHYTLDLSNWFGRSFRLKMNYRKWAFIGLLVFPLYLLGRASFAVPVWVDLLVGLLLGLLILPSLFFRSAATGIAVLVLFVMAFPSLSEMDYGTLAKPGLLFLFALWVVLVLVISLDRSRARLK